MKTFDIDECAEFLKINRETALQLAGVGKLTGAKIGRAWEFLVDDLVEYIKAQVRLQQRQHAVEADVQMGLDASAARTPPSQSMHPMAGRRKSKRLVPNLDLYEVATPAKTMS